MSTSAANRVAPPKGPPLELLLSSSFLLKKLGFQIKERSLAAMEPLGIAPHHHGVLVLLEEGSCSTQGTIADRLGYDRSVLVGLLDDLEHKGYVQRTRDPGDRRRHLVTLTPTGREALAEMRAVAKKVEKEFLAPLDADERRKLHELLLRLAAYHDPGYGTSAKG